MTTAVAQPNTGWGVAAAAHAGAGYGRWKALVEELTKKHKIKVVVRGRDCKTDGDTVYLPEDVPASLEHGFEAMVYHECWHVKKEDPDYMRRKALSNQGLSLALNLVQDLRNDCDIMRAYPKQKDGYRGIMEYFELKAPKDPDYVMSVLVELRTRSYPYKVAKGFHIRDPKVRRWFKKHKAYRKLIAQMKKEKKNGKVTLFWAKWLVDNLLQNVSEDKKQKLNKEYHKNSPGHFEMVTREELPMPGPDDDAARRLAEFLIARNERAHREETGRLDPAMLPQFRTAPNLFQEEVEPLTKTTVYLVLDRSGSMLWDQTMADGSMAYEALCRGAQTVCAAVEKAADDTGEDIAVKVTGFDMQQWTFKERDEKLNPEKLAADVIPRAPHYDGTDLHEATELTDKEPTEMKEKAVVVMITDGHVEEKETRRLQTVGADGKLWVLLGLGLHVQGNMFKNISTVYSDVTRELVKAVQEAL